MIDEPGLTLPPGMEIEGPLPVGAERVLTAGALALVATLSRSFRPRVDELLERRREAQRRLDAGERPAFPAATAHLREDAWKVASPLPDLLDRRVEVIDATDRKAILEAIDSGSSVFVADLEDGSPPTWRNVVQAQLVLKDALERTGEHAALEAGGRRRPGARPAVLMLQPRGWHLLERHVRVDGRPVPAPLWDFGVFFWNNARALVARGSAPCFRLARLEGHLEARLWNDVFELAQATAGLPRGTVRATCLVDTLPAAFEMDEILWELREHTGGLGFDARGYLFSFIKRLRADPRMVLPDRDQLGLDAGFLRACVQLLARTCQRRGAPAVGAPPGQRPWTAEPVTARDLLRPPAGTRTEAGLRHDLRDSVQVLESWLRGQGRPRLHGSTEDLSTAELCRALAWQSIHHGLPLDDGRPLTVERFRTVLAEEQARLRLELGERRFAEGRFEEARDLLERTSTGAEFVEFLTLPAGDLLERPEAEGAPLSASHPAGSPAPPHPDPHRWEGILRGYGHAEVERLRGSVHVEHTLARLGAERLWALLHERPFVPALGALTGNQAVQMVRAGLEAIYLSGWQVAADANTALQTYPDQSLYPADSVPQVVRRINRALQRADEIEHAEGRHGIHWFAPIVADAEAGFGGPLNAFELMKAMIDAGAAGVHFEDQVAAEKKCGHLGGKVLVPTSTFLRTLAAARLAADVMGVPTLLVARTDAEAATLIMNDVDPQDAPFIDRDQRTPEGFFRFRGGLEAAIARGVAYAPYADLVWCETQTPDLDFARRFAEAVHAKHPGKLLSYNCSPSFNWRKHMDEAALGRFQRELSALGYRFQFVTLAGFHALNHSMFQLARGYRERGMAAYSDLQEAEIAAESAGYTATRHQREVGVGYFDLVTTTVSGGNASTLALEGSTEKAQFRPTAPPGASASTHEVRLAIDEDHRRLEELTLRLERSADGASVAAALEDLSRTLREHFAHEEHAKGLYGLVGSREPALRDELQRLVEEHQEILRIVSGLVERTQAPEAEAAGELATMAGALAERIAEHESRELRLVSAL